MQGDDGPEQKRYDRFRDRIMFPIRSVQGEVIGFGGRVLDSGEPKYLNSPETPIFVKGRELYGLFEARTALRSKGYVLVVEGYMDVVALAQNGFANAVATLGTACTAEHVQKLFRFTDSVVFSFDGDAAGRRAAGRALEAALPHATDLRSVRFLFLPPEHDPDSFVRELGAAAFDEQVAQAVPLSRQLIEHASQGADLGSAEGRARMLAQARPLWQALPDGALRRQLLPELAAPCADGAGRPGRAVGPGPGARVPHRPRPGARRLRGTPPRAAGRRAPAGLADQALRLLLRHNEWWERCPARIRACCTNWAACMARCSPGWSGRSPNMARRPGPRSTTPWPTRPGPRRRAAGSRPWSPTRSMASRTCSACCSACGSTRCGEDAEAIASSGPDAEGLARLRQLRERIASLKASLTGAGRTSRLSAGSWV